VLAHEPLERGAVEPAGAEGVHPDRDRLGHADGVGELHLAAGGEARRDQVLRHPARGVGGAAVHLGRVLAREGAAAVPAHAAVGVDDDLAAGEPGVAHRAADHEAAGGVHVEDGPLVDPLGRQRGPDHVVDQRLAQLVVADVGVVLGREHHGVDAAGAAVGAVLDGDLGLRVGPQPVERARLEVLPGDLHDPVRQPDRRGHQLGRLVAGVAEHHPLVAGALLLVQALALVTPWEMSGDCWPSATSTPQVSASKPISESVYPMSRTTERARCSYSTRAAW
jgi:hypothetical protein